MKNDTTFVRMRSSDHLGDSNTLKKAARFVELNFLTIATDENSFCRMKEEGQIYKNVASGFLFFLPKELVMIFLLPVPCYDLSKFRIIFPCFFFFFERPQLSP